MTAVTRPLGGHTAIVTGGNGGIGLAIVTALAEAGARVAVWGRNPTKNQHALDRLRGDGHHACAQTVDVTDERAVDDAFGRVVDEFGIPTVVVANAAITGTSGPFVDLDVADWRRTVEANLDATMLPLRAAVRALIAADTPGSLVTVSSIVTSFGAPGKAAYAASKAGTTAVALSLAVELAPYGIRSNVLRPGWTDTDMIGADGAYGGELYDRFQANTVKRTPVRRWGTPDEMGPAAVFLADPRHSFHTGDIVTVDGGYCIA
jgi:NAD(P)-dependent dehydrogenase (short-subunit alcohol dehydrogenase family)